MEGIYIAYLTAIHGQSVALFVLNRGTITGADIGGGAYDGKYEVDRKSQTLQLDIQFNLPLGTTSITGETAEKDENRIETSLIIDFPIDRDKVYELSTPIGDVNAKFKLLRKL